MKVTLLNHVVCPKCTARFSLHVDREESGEVRSGFLTCSKGHCEFPIKNFVPRFVEAEEYAESFSVQRRYVRGLARHYASYGRAEKLFLATTGFTRAELHQAVTLEVGCGYGRFLRVVGDMGSEAIGVDLSTESVELAHDLVGFHPNIHVIQSDLFNLPFRERYFEKIFSIGVLHHTPNTRKAFEAILPYLREGGRISIWVYHPDDKRYTDRWRVVTTKLPYRILYAFCVLNQGMFSWIRALPGGSRFKVLVPGIRPGGGRKFWLRVMGDFDSFSPPYAHSHTEHEVEGWYREAGLERVEVLERRTSVTGTRHPRNTSYG